MANIFDLFKKIEKSSSNEPVSAIVAGLGNPGDKYDKTRHNIGFMAIDYIAEKCGEKINRGKFNALICEVNVGGSRVILMKPQTFMNNSGTANSQAASFYKIPNDRVIVLHDEISFDPGVIRIRRKGSAGGHNGLKNIIECLPGEDFPRIKIGVGQKPRPDYDLVDWVLGRMPDIDIKAIENRLTDISSAVELIATGRIDDAMQKFSK